MDQTRRELTELEKNLRKLEFQQQNQRAVEGASTMREGSPSNNLWSNQDESQRTYIRQLGMVGDAPSSPQKIPFDQRGTAVWATRPGEDRQSPYSRTMNDWQGSPSKRSQVESYLSSNRNMTQRDLSPQRTEAYNLLQVPGQKLPSGQLPKQIFKQSPPRKDFEYNALSDYVDPDNSVTHIQDATALLAQDRPLDSPPKAHQTHVQSIIKLKALKLMDVYKQLQQAVLNGKKSGYDSFKVESLQDPRANGDAVAKLLNNKPQQLAADNILLDQKMLSDESLTDVINSPQVHILSVLAIADDNQEIFKRIVRFLSMKGWELPKNHMIYDQDDWEKVKLSKSSYLHGLVSEALQAAIQMDWLLQCDSIITYAKSQEFLLSITSESLSALIENEAYDLMITLLEHKVFFAKKKSTPFKESDQQTQVMTESNGRKSQELFGLLNIKLDRTWQNDQHLQKQLKGKTQRNLQVQKEFQEDVDDGVPKDQDLVKMLLQEKKPAQQPFNLLQGEQILTPAHILQQLFLDKPELAHFKADKNLKLLMHTLLLKLSSTSQFSKVVPVLIINSNRDAVYLMLQNQIVPTVRKSAKNQDKQVVDQGEITQDDDDILSSGQEILDKITRKQLAQELFSFSISQEQLDEAINVYQKYASFLQANAAECIQNILTGIQFSAAFFELKLFLLSQFVAQIQRQHISDFFEAIEGKILSDFSPFHSHRSLLLQNLNPLRVSMQTMHMLRLLAEIEPVHKSRCERICDKLENNVCLILDSIKSEEYCALAEACWVNDIFNRSIIWYLQDQKPLKILGTSFCNKIICELWYSSYQTHNGSFLDYSTSFQVLWKQQTLKQAQPPTFASVCKRPTKNQLHGCAMPVWQNSSYYRFIIDFTTSLVLTIIAQISLVFFNQNLKTALKLKTILQNSKKPINFEGMNPELQKDVQLAFINTVVLVAIGFLLAVTRPLNDLLTSIYLDKTKTNLNWFQFRIGQLLLIVTAAINCYELITMTIQPVNILGVGDQNVIKYDVRFMLNLASELDRHQSLRFNVSLAAMMFFMWINQLMMLKVTQIFGPPLIIMGEMVKQVASWFVIWLSQVVIFYSLIIMLYFDSDAYENRFQTLINVLESSAGGWEVGLSQYENVRFTSVVGKILHIIFILCNFLGWFAVLVSVFSSTYTKMKHNQQKHLNTELIMHLPQTKYDDRWGWMILLPTVWSPFVLLILPIMNLCSRCCKGTFQNKSMNLARMFYTPLALTYLVGFIILNMVLGPLAYISGLMQACKINGHQERLQLSPQRPKQQQSKTVLVVVWLFAGPLILLVSQFTDAVHFFLRLYTPSGHHIFQVNIQSQKKLLSQQQGIDNFKDLSLLHQESLIHLSLPNFQKLYKVVALQVVRTLQGEFKQSNQSKKEQFKMTIKTVSTELRKLMQIDKCIQSMTFGDVYGVDKLEFFASLLSDGQSEQERIQSFNLIKSVITKFRVDEDFMPKVTKKNVHIRGGVLWQMLKEIKMKLMAKVYLRQHSEGKKIAHVEFMKLERNESVDNALKEILVACPTVVLQTLRSESKQETQDRFNSELVRLQTKILKQQQMQILQHQLQQVTSPSKTQKPSKLNFNDRESARDLQPRASLDPAARLDVYHGTLAQQELTYTDISQLDVPAEIAGMFSYRSQKAASTKIKVGSDDITQQASKDTLNITPQEPIPSPQPKGKQAPQPKEKPIPSKDKDSSKKLEPSQSTPNFKKNPQKASKSRSPSTKAISKGKRK